MAEPNPPSRSVADRVRQFFVTTGIALVVAAIAAGYVWYGQSTKVGQLETELERSDSVCDERVAEVAAERDVARTNNSRLHAFLDVAGARAELTQGNFGTARSRSEAASRHLEAGGDAELAARVAGIDIQVTDDLAVTQAALADVEKAIEALIDRPEAGE
ncbi:MAG: hypothetical protein AAGA48_09610 [Myxococcota bacterium]